MGGRASVGGRSQPERSGQANYSYDADDLLTSAGTLSLSRSASTGEVTSASIGTTTTAYDRDAVYGELEELKTTTAGGAVAFKQVMARDSVGRVSALQETVDGQTSEYTYTYDQRGRLTGVERGGQPWAGLPPLRWTG